MPPIDVVVHSSSRVFVFRLLNERARHFILDHTIPENRTFALGRIVVELRDELRFGPRRGRVRRLRGDGRARVLAVSLVGCSPCSEAWHFVGGNGQHGPFKTKEECDRIHSDVPSIYGSTLSSCWKDRAR